MESSYFTIKGPSHLTKHSYSYLSVSIFHCFINKNSEFCGHISSGLHLPGFTWPVIFFSGFYDWNWLKNGSLSPASECLLFYSSGYLTHEITVRPYHEKNANALPFAPVRCMQETKALKEKRYRKSCHKLHGSFGPRDHFDLRRLYCILNNFKMICQLLTSIYNVISGQSNVPPSSEILITMEFLNYQFHLIWFLKNYPEMGVRLF